MASDESADRNKEGVNNFMVYTGGDGPWLVKSVFYGTQRQNANNIGKEIETVREEIKQIGSRDTAYLSDNCNTQQAVRTEYKNKVKNASLVGVITKKIQFFASGDKFFLSHFD